MQHVLCARLRAVEIIACALLLAEVKAVSIRRAASTMLTCERDSLQEEEGPNSQHSLNSQLPSFSCKGPAPQVPVHEPGGEGLRTAVPQLGLALCFCFVGGSALQAARRCQGGTGAHMAQLALGSSRRGGDPAGRRGNGAAAARAWIPETRLIVEVAQQKAFCFDLCCTALLVEASGAARRARRLRGPAGARAAMSKTFGGLGCLV